MKILQTNFFNYPRQSYQITPYKRHENNHDTFAKSNNSLTFTGQQEDADLFKQIAQNPSMSQKFMELMSNVAAVLVTKAFGNNSVQNNQDENIDNIVKIVVEKPDNHKEEKAEIELLKRDMRELREENKRLRELVERRGFGTYTIPQPPVVGQEEDVSDTSTEEISDTADEKSEELHDIEPVDTPAPAEEKPSGYVFEFPKKKVGILSKSQKELKAVTSNIKTDEKTGEKLTGICKELLQKGSHEIDGQIVDNKDLTDELSQKLKECSPEEVPQVVDEFYKKCGLAADEVNSEEAPAVASEDSSIQETSKEETGTKGAPKPEIYETERPVLPGVTVKGKIDLSSINDRRPKGKNSADKPASTSEPAERKKRPRIGQQPAAEQTQNPKNDFKTTSELRVINPNSKTSVFTIPGTVDKKVKNDLTRLLLYFEDMVEKDVKKPRYQCSKALSVKVLERDVLDEIREQKKRDPESPYTHINKSNASEVAEAINSDPRFHEMFAMHAAMRLIDRYVDFNSDVPLDKQCNIILDKLEELLKKSFKEGIEVRRYKDTNNSIGARIIIPEKAYDEESRRIFGTYPLGLGLSENQPKLPYYDVNHKEPLIYTVFIKGI